MCVCKINITPSRNPDETLELVFFLNLLAILWIAWDIRKDLHADRGVGGNNVDITHTERVYNSGHSPVNQMRSYRKHLKWQQQQVFIEIWGVGMA